MFIRLIIFINNISYDDIFVVLFFEQKSKTLCKSKV